MSLKFTNFQLSFIFWIVKIYHILYLRTVRLEVDWNQSWKSLNVCIVQSNQETTSAKFFNKPKELNFWLSNMFQIWKIYGLFLHKMVSENLAGRKEEGVWNNPSYCCTGWIINMCTRIWEVSRESLYCTNQLCAYIFSIDWHNQIFRCDIFRKLVSPAQQKIQTGRLECKKYWLIIPLSVAMVDFVIPILVLE